MKKLFTVFLFLMTLLPIVEASANTTSPVMLTFQLYWDDTSFTHNGSPKSPPEAPTAYLDGHTLSLSGAHPSYVVQLVDPYGLTYQTSLSSIFSEIVFPPSFSGTYELRLVVPYEYYFSTTINL